MAQDKLTDVGISAIDKALAAVAARKAAKANGDASAASSTGERPAKAAKVVTPKVSDEDKAAEKAKRLAERETERATRNAAREQARAERLAERANKSTTKSPAHMKKVAKAAGLLGTLNDIAQTIFVDATTNLPAAQVAVLAAHLTHFNRVKATERALNQAVTAGQTVSIIGGDPRYIGLTGTVAKAQRIRCYVTVAGINKPVYCFTSDVQPIAEQATDVTEDESEVQSTGTDA